MMEASDEARAPSPPTGDACEMLFYRRPDVHTRALFFRSGAARSGSSSTPTQELAVPVQLVDMDGNTHIGMSPAAATPHRFAEITVHPGTSSDARRGHREDRLARLLVTSNALHDSSTETRVRVIKVSFHGTALLSTLLSVVLLLPSDKYVYGSMSDEDIAQRVENRRVPLIALSTMSCLLGIVASCMESVTGLWGFIFGTIVCDTWVLAVYLPHVFYLLRLIIDVLLIYLAVELRSYLVPSWFVTNFHRLRY